MDSIIHARFFRVSNPDVGVTDFPDIFLEMMANSKKAGDRERDIAEGVRVRLERCDVRNDYVDGELCRVQTENFPPQAGPNGLAVIPLGDGNGIGHVAAFVYHKPTRVLLLQRNASSVTIGRLSLYLAQTNANRLFAFKPVLGEDAMERFKSKEPRGFAVTFAGPENLQALDDAGISAAKGAKLIAEAYNGVRVKIEVSVGRSRKKWLGKETILEDLGHLVDAEGVKRLQVNAAAGGEDDVINFIKEQLHVEKTLDIPGADHEKSYVERNLFLRKAFSDNLATLNAQFAGNQGG